MEEQIRKQAIVRYVNGESPKTICTELNRSKPWFFKWLKRYQTGDLDWYKDKSKSPVRRPTKTNDRKRQLIVATRKRLESEAFAQIGISAIKWELAKLGVDFPSDSTIKRILKEEGLVKKKLPTHRRESSIPTSGSHLAATTFTRRTLWARAT